MVGDGLYDVTASNILSLVVSEKQKWLIGFIGTKKGFEKKNIAS